MASGIDALFLADHALSKNIKLFYLVPYDMPEEVWARQFLPMADIIFYRLKNKKISMTMIDFEGMVHNSDIASLLKKNKVDYLLVDHGVDKSLYSWAKKHNIKLIATDFKLSECLEHKIYFDSFLSKYNLPKPASQIISPASKLELKGKLVLQDPVSCGGDGTYFIKNSSDIKKLLLKKKIKASQKYLLRQFVKGETYGITIFITPSQIALSALRVQCYDGISDLGQKIFAGIEWLPSRLFKTKLQANINSVFLRLAKALEENHFFGYANIDFIVDDKDEIYIIECNPRFAASTTQLLKFTETIGNINTDKIFVEDFILKTAKNIKQKISYFPQSNFKGALLYIQTALDVKKFLVSKEYPGGVYRLQNNKIKFITPDVRRISLKAKEFIFYSDTRKGEYHEANTVLASIVSNFSLYNGSHQPNKYAKLILKYFKY